MAANTRYVVLSVPNPAGAPADVELEGVFASMPDALGYIAEMHDQLGVPLTAFEVEGWRGRDFQGVWDYTGALIEDRKGRVRGAYLSTAAGE